MPCLSEKQAPDNLGWILNSAPLQLWRVSPDWHQHVAPTQPCAYLCFRDSLCQGGEWGWHMCSYIVRADHGCQTEWWRESGVPRVFAENAVYTQVTLCNSPTLLHSRWGATIEQGQQSSTLHTTGSPLWQGSIEMVWQPCFNLYRCRAPFLVDNSCGCLPACSAVFSLLLLFVQLDQCQSLGLPSTLTSPTLQYRCVLPL